MDSSFNILMPQFSAQSFEKALEDYAARSGQLNVNSVQKSNAAIFLTHGGFCTYDTDSIKNSREKMQLLTLPLFQFFLSKIEKSNVNPSESVVTTNNLQTIEKYADKIKTINATFIRNLKDEGFNIENLVAEKFRSIKKQYRKALSVLQKYTDNKEWKNLLPKNLESKLQKLCDKAYEVNKILCRLQNFQAKYDMYSLCDDMIHVLKQNVQPLSEAIQRLNEISLFYQTDKYCDIDFAKDFQSEFKLLSEMPDGTTMIIPDSDRDFKICYSQSNQVLTTVSSIELFLNGLVSNNDCDDQMPFGNLFNGISQGINPIPLSDKARVKKTLQILHKPTIQEITGFIALNQLIEELSGAKNLFKLLDEKARISDSLKLELQKKLLDTIDELSLLGQLTTHYQPNFSTFAKYFDNLNMAIGTTVITETLQPGYFDIYCVTKAGMIKQNNPFKIHTDGQISIKDHEEKWTLANLIQDITGECGPRKLVWECNDFAIGQLEGYVAADSKEKMQAQAEPGTCFITRGDCEDHYILWTIDADRDDHRRVQGYRLKVCNNRIACYGIEGLEVAIASNLEELLDKEFDGQYILYKKPLAAMEPVEHYVYQVLLPKMWRNGRYWTKFSRNDHPNLHNSLWVNLQGEIFAQHHSCKKTALGNFSAAADNNEEIKHFINSGFNKRIFALQSLNTHNKMVRAVRSDKKKKVKEVETIKQLKRELGTQYFVIPTIVKYNDHHGNKAVTQIMPHMEGKDLFSARQALTSLGFYNALHDVAKGLVIMHDLNWVHRDIKPENTLLQSQDVNNPKAKIADFDSATKIVFGNDILRFYGTKGYIDPAVYRKIAKGLEGGKLADQFSFGAMIYFCITNIHLDKRDSRWIVEDDLNNIQCEEFKKIVRLCCVGSQTQRSYHLPKIINMLDQAADRMKTIESQISK